MEKQFECYGLIAVHEVEKPNELLAARQRHRARKDKCANINTKLLPAHYYQY